MAEKLEIPKLQQAAAITDSVGRPTFAFHRWWDSVARTVADSINNLFDNLVSLGLFNPDGTVGERKVVASSIAANSITSDAIAPSSVKTESMDNNSATVPWLMYSDAVINFPSSVKYEVFSVNIDKELSDSLLEVHGQIPLYGGDAVDVYVTYDVLQDGVLAATRQFTLKVDGNADIYLPFAYEHYFDTLDAGAYSVKMSVQRFTSNTCNTTGQYHIRIREFKR